MSIETKIIELVSTLNKHSFAYHTQDESSCPDEEYNAMYQELKSLEELHPQYILPYSPTQRVGDKISQNFKPVTHKEPMLSLDNAFTLDQFKKAFEMMCGSKGVVAELKADGLAMSLHYENGVLVDAVTRGTGIVGESVLHTVRTVKTIPLKLNTKTPPPFIEVRGEVTYPLKEFDKYNELQIRNGKKPLSNARNGAAGAIRKHDPKLAAERKLSFQAYSIGFAEGYQQKDHLDLLSELNSWGFLTSEYSKICYTVDECQDVYNEIIEMKRDNLFSILMDGIVFKTNRQDLRVEIGQTNHHPKWAIAWKLPEKPVSTKLLDIIYSTGASGAITPVAILEPVHVGGVIVSRSTLHNQDELNRLKLMTGDTVFLIRAGAVVPKILHRDENLTVEGGVPYTFATHCPCCQSELQKIDAIWYCTNKSNCSAQKINYLAKVVSRDCLNIDGVGEAMIKSLYDLGLLSSYPDLFKLHQHRDVLITIDGYGEKSISKALENIETAKTMPLDRFIYSLSIKEVGRSLSLDLAKHFKSLDHFLNATDKELKSLPDLGDKICDYIHSFLSRSESISLINDLLDSGVTIINPEMESETDNLYAGKSFAITGSFTMIQRAEIESHIKGKGGKVSGSPSKNTFALVVGNNAGSKLEKAKALNLRIITDEDIVRITSGDAGRLTEALLP